MPRYEYECRNGCLNTKKKPLRHDRLRPMSEYRENSICPECGQEAQKIVTGISSFRMGFKHLKDKSEKSPPAPTDSGYHPEWDQAYGPTRSGDTIKT